LIQVEQWAEIRRMHFVEHCAIKEIARRTGMDRKTIRRAIRLKEPPRYRRAPVASKLDPHREQISRLLGGVEGITNTGIREPISEAGYEGSKTILDDYLRELRPIICPKRTYQRTVYRPAELLQFDLFEPKVEIPVGYGQTRRSWVVTCELGFSRPAAGALVFSKTRPDLLWGMNRCLKAIGGLPETLAWDREGAIHRRGDHLVAEDLPLPAEESPRRRPSRRAAHRLTARERSIQNRRYTVKSQPTLTLNVRTEVEVAGSQPPGTTDRVGDNAARSLTSSAPAWHADSRLPARCYQHTQGSSPENGTWTRSLSLVARERFREPGS
jgi:hypothetical protein